MVAHAYNPSTLEAEPGGLYKLETRLDYKVSSKSAWVTELNPPYLIKKKVFCSNIYSFGGRLYYSIYTAQRTASIFVFQHVLIITVPPASGF